MFFNTNLWLNFTWLFIKYYLVSLLDIFIDLVNILFIIWCIKPHLKHHIIHNIHVWKIIIFWIDKILSKNVLYLIQSSIKNIIILKKFNKYFFNIIVRFEYKIIYDLEDLLTIYNINKTWKHYY